MTVVPAIHQMVSSGWRPSWKNDDRIPAGDISESGIPKLTERHAGSDTTSFSPSGFATARSTGMSGRECIVVAILDRFCCFLNAYCPPWSSGLPLLCE
ncbi:hypothetical protein Hamer_G004269 [Homarus americanus]|uniref:Uncharacterized protein n=1 Tax=Homarus americanus TaxID=6706 RepID=A0A8J5MQ57_HOMAM|nr:hypothetical protein Hamer_G004269 [Homarus americanus]